MHKAISFVHVFKFIFENHYITTTVELWGLTGPL